MNMNNINNYEIVKNFDSQKVNQLREFINAGCPFVFEINWPAIGKWSTEYLCEIAGDEEVSVSMSIDEQSAPTVRKKFTLKDYVKLIEHADKNVVKDGSKNVPYLKQFDLLSIRPELRNDIDFTFLPTGRKDIAFWLGTRSSVTGLHCDPNNGILAQIYGSKRIYLFSPGQRELLYPNNKYDPATECCDVDATQPDYNRHPKFSGARGMKVEISKGQALFIPKGWYHQVVGLENNISINCFFFSYMNLVTTDLIHYRIPKILHDLGLYRRGNCVCHNSGK
jgi:hypothetical protein